MSGGDPISRMASGFKTHYEVMIIACEGNPRFFFIGLGFCPFAKRGMLHTGRMASANSNTLESYNLPQKKGNSLSHSSSMFRIVLILESGAGENSLPFLS